MVNLTTNFAGKLQDISKGQQGGTSLLGRIGRHDLFGQLVIDTASA
jgi:hypothetical protein